jgi:nitrogenase-associated protein
MAKIVFYEKPGCPVNLGQKNHLIAAGFEVEARDLTTENWTPASLRAYFADKPVAEWFDPQAPQIQSGEIEPKYIKAQEALVMMAIDPALIKSPLVKIDGRCGSGLEGEELEVFLGLKQRVSNPKSNAPQAWGNN